QNFQFCTLRAGRWALLRTRDASGGPGPCSADQEAIATGPIWTAATRRTFCRSGTRDVRQGDWRVAPLAPGLVDLRVEITGPTDRKLVNNALNCGAKIFLADFEDSNTPTSGNRVTGQLNVRNASRRRYRRCSPDSAASKMPRERSATSSPPGSG